MRKAEINAHTHSKTQSDECSWRNETEECQTTTLVLTTVHNEQWGEKYAHWNQHDTISFIGVNISKMLKNMTHFGTSYTVKFKCLTQVCIIFRKWHTNIISHVKIWNDHG